ncbi:hydroxyacid dehydrogenase [Pedobacter chinensis]|uniref:Hydroxyacid dehydrogenase n=1 Tax=Pedobacter chinensis TaxID=2282421 RepID=A0A369PYV4_9SPHI|nr:2-hydroxyacid dehydrogenase [Pedobacter chinensis]RDC56385.1 hydroxyacid dehydrogenase [Pedobacter chinensis]
MRILVTAPYNDQGRDILEKNFGKVIYKTWKDQGRSFNEEELINLLAETRADALITEHDHVTEKVIETFPDLQFIGVCRGTPSNVAVKTAEKHGIPVFHTPARNAQAVAEMFVANVINILRMTIPSWQWLTGENWEAGAHTSYLQFKGNELANKTIGMVGFGAVGQRIAEILKCFPCNIQFYDPFLDEYDPNYHKTTLEDIFETSDIVSIHLPVNSHTVGMINSNLISRMKPEAIFVNTARASVVDRDALLYAIQNDKIRGAVLDVFDHEPPDEKDYQLIHSPKVLATPHTAGATHEVEDHHVNILNAKLLSWLKEGKLVDNKVKS